MSGPGANATMPPPLVSDAVPIVGASGTPAGTVRPKNRWSLVDAALLLDTRIRQLV